MKLLLDTRAFIWWDSEPSKLGRRALDACCDPANTVLLSVASAWEMEIKRQLGKLALRMPLPEIIAQQRAANGIGLLDLQLPHVLQLGSLPTPHKDPFDRILVAQALVEGATLVTVDPAIEAYPVPVLW